MPCKEAKARKLLRDKKAFIKSYKPFTIKLAFECENSVQTCFVGLDTGSRKIGLSVITEKGLVLYRAEAELRQDIKDNVSKKRRLRKARRQRKTPYRPARFLNRKRKKSKLPPSIRSRINSHYFLIKKVSQFLPIQRIVTEAGQFDVQAIINPHIEGTEYQNGVMKGYDSVKEYVRIRDKFLCHYKELRPDILCNEKLVIDHIIPVSKGGTDRPDNLISSCENHNNAKSNRAYKEFTGKKLHKIESFKETAFMNVIRDYLIPELQKIAPTAITYGFYTRRKRKEWQLDKSHINDSIGITGIKPVKYTDNIYHIKQVRKKKRSLHEEIPRKGRSKPNTTAKRNRKNIKSIEQKGLKWSLWDKVFIQELDKIGFISGFTDKWAYIQDINGSYLQITGKYRQVNPKKIRLICRNNNYIYLEDKSNHRKDSSFIST
jgi:N6-L-threonylcarbamoyladenine synthase